MRSTTAILLFVIFYWPATVLAGPYGFVIPESETYRSCEKRESLPTIYPAQRFRTQLGFGLDTVLTPANDPSPFAIDVGLGYRLANVWFRCHRVTTGLFRSRTHRALGLGPSARVVVVPGRPEQSRVSGGVQLSYDSWPRGGLFSEFAPAGFQIDTGPSWGPGDGLGYHVRIGFFGLLAGMGVRFDHLFDSRSQVLGFSYDLTNLHLLWGIDNR